MYISWLSIHLWGFPTPVVPARTVFFTTALDFSPFLPDFHHRVTTSTRFWSHNPRQEMVERKASFTRLLPSTSMSKLRREEKWKEHPIISSPIRLPRRRTSVVRITFEEDSSDSEHQPTPRPRTTTSTSAKLLRLTSKSALRSLETSSNSSLRPVSRASLEVHSSPGQGKSSFRPKAPKPLKLDERTPASHPEHLAGREATSPSYEEQFRRRRGDPLHRLGPSVPYMQAYDPTSLQWWVLRFDERLPCPIDLHPVTL